ncbi:hypothetical protein [Mucilaginibacter dorajii]|uniref:Brp/Blh family beta-carotene 15,15'-monooxygenase n=1 Tax=Mucilaginibacter dorajii TaxID=692994 RepID=A0ABP7PYL7_9SPHI|nr:hypothetical protein [Mucilaginibacter dorajii]MCS3736464.1 hypothetical protein [Mucilaginibacter dorajii]
MKDQDIHAELSSIRDLMERSSKFISLSGLSGIMAGIYALLGAGLAYNIVYKEHDGVVGRVYYENAPQIIPQLFLIALFVLILSLATGIILSYRKAKKMGQSFWNTSSKRLLINLAIPLVTGGLFILILFLQGRYSTISSASLIFYGLALVSASHYTYKGVRGLGILEILLGLLAALIPGYGLIFWATGFGLLHIIYGTVMHFRYDK